MKNNIFVNEGFNYALNEYIEHKNNPNGVEFNSFLVVVIRLLTIIYDELDLLTPYYLKNEESLDMNLKKYGYPKEDIYIFKSYINQYYDNASEEKFVLLQKMLIDMFACKKASLKLAPKELDSFRDLLYTPWACNPLIISYNFFMSNNLLEISKYFDEKITQVKPKVVIRPREVLNMGAYKMLNYDADVIDKMTADELDEVNKKVYNHLSINENAINKDYLIDKAVYDFNHPKPAMTTGNGYIDILYILAIIATIILIILIITIIIG